MSESASVAPSAPTNGASSSTQQTPAPQATRSGTQNTQSVQPTGRSPGGQFLPKDGTVGQVAQEGKTPGQTPAEVKEERRLRLRLKEKDGEREWEGTEADAQREIQQGRHNARKVQELMRKLQEKEANEKLAAENPEEFLRAHKIDPAEFSKAQISKLIEMEAMNEDQRARLQAEQERDELKSWKQKQEEAHKAAQLEARTHQARTSKLALYKEAIAASGQEPSHDLIRRMAQTEKMMWDEYGRNDLSPQELATEAARRMDSEFASMLGNLSVPALVAKIGAKRMEALLQHSINEFEKASGQPLSNTQQAEESPPPTQGWVDDEQEANRRIREMRRRFGSR